MHVHSAETLADATRAATAASARRSWLTWQRSAVSVVRFRAAVGIALCVFFMRQQHESAPLFEAGLLALPLRGALSAGTAATALFGSGACLALGIALNVRPRLCAALLLPIAIYSQRALAPLPRLDDWMSVVALWWMLLLPGADARARAPGSKVPAPTVALMLGHVLLSYAWLSGVRAMSPMWPPFEGRWLAALFSCVPAFYLLPIGPVRWLGPPVQLALHAYLAVITGEWLAHAVLAASSILLIGDLVEERERSARAPVDGSFVVAACYTVLLLLAAAGGAIGLGSSAQRARHVLADLGLAPSRAAVGVPETALAFHEGEHRRAWSEVSELPDASSVRTRLLWSRLGAASRAAHNGLDGSAPVPERALRAVAARYCERFGTSRSFGPEVALVLDDMRQPAPPVLARFDCGAPDSSARFVRTGG